MPSSALPAALLRRPDLPEIVRQLDALVREEASRREAFRAWLDEDKKAEFINGQTVMHSPVKRKHLSVSSKLSLLLNIHVRLRKLGEIMIEKALIALTRNDYEPDLCFFTSERAATFTPDQMLFPAPDFVVEILSKSTAKFDRGIKLEDYAAHGVREYWIIDPDRQHIEQYLRIGNDTTFMPPYLHRVGDTVESQVVTAFVLPIKALFDDAACEKAMQDILAGHQ
jgi:Uma2 family endonuclease